MKKLLLLLAVVLASSCSKDSIDVDNCRCKKNVYETELVVYMKDGVARTRLNKTFMYYELVPCQDEISGQISKDIIFEIECN